MANTYMAESGKGMPKSEGMDEPEGPDKSGDDDETDNLLALHEEFRIEFQSIQEEVYPERLENLRDRRFVDVPGSQWEGELGEQFENKPKLEIDKTSQSVDDIVTEFQENQIDATFISKDGALDTDLADTCASLRRADQQDSCADEAKTNCFREMATGGIGAYMLEPAYEDPEVDPDDADPDEPQRIRYTPIYDADRTVFYDSDAKMADKSDATTCYLLYSVTKAKYKKMYPHDDPADWPNTVHQREFDWQPDNRVQMVVVYRKERVNDVACYYQPPGKSVPDTGDYIDPEGLERYYESELANETGRIRDLKAMGYKKVKEKKVLRNRVHRYIMNGVRILEDEGFIAGSEIPVIIAMGRRVTVDGMERIRGHVRKARDPQMIKNAMLSKLLELAAQSVAKKPIMSPEQMEGHDDTWSEDTIANRAWLPINRIPNAAGDLELQPPVSWIEPQPMPPVMSALHQQVDADIKEILRTPAAAQETKSHVPNSALTEVLSRVDSKCSQFMYNMGKAIRWEGIVWLGMAIELYYQKGRKMKGVSVKGDATKIELHKATLDDNDMPKKANDLSRARFSVAVEVGPSSESKQDAAFEAGTKILGVIEDPEAKQVMTYHCMKYMRGEGVNDLRKWGHGKLLRMNVGTPTPAEAEEIRKEREAAANAKPSAIDQLALAQAKSELAKAQKLLAEHGLTVAQTEKTRVDATVALSNVHLDNEQAAIDKVVALSGVNLDEKKAIVDAADTLHGMQPAPVQPPSGESGSSGSQGSS